VKEAYRITVQERTGSGKGAARKVRAGGGCPAVMYGPGIESRSLQVDPGDLDKLLQSGGENALIDLEISGSAKASAESVKVIIRDLYFSPLGDRPEHIDFYKVSLDKKITISVSIEMTGTCEAVTTKRGTISQQMYEVTVECLPGDIPEKFEADISGLDVGDTFHVRDLPLPDGVSLGDSLDLPIVTVSAIKEEVVEEEEVAAEVEAAEPEVIGEEKAEGAEASGE
jgi:large subunit ribosomal protein L25